MDVFLWMFVSSVKEINRILKETNRLLKDINRLLNEINSLLSKGMSNVYLKVTR